MKVGERVVRFVPSPSLLEQASLDDNTPLAEFLKAKYTPSGSDLIGKELDKQTKDSNTPESDPTRMPQKGAATYVPPAGTVFDQKPTFFLPQPTTNLRTSKNNNNKSNNQNVDPLTGSTTSTPLVSPLSQQQSLSSLNTTSSLFPGPPKFISFDLVNDTAPGGATNTDLVTSDPTIRVTVPSPEQVVEWKAGIGNTEEANYVDISQYLQRQTGVSIFNRAILETINRGPLVDGGYALYILTKWNSGGFQEVSRQGFGFVLDTTPPAQPTFNLDAASDSGVIGDRKTTNATVTLAGQTTANTTVTLQQSNAVTTSDSTGKFTFTSVPLVMGDNLFTARATDIAGNTSIFSTTITREPQVTVTLTNNAIAENSPTGTVIGQLNTNNTSSYSYTLVDNASGRFRIVNNQLQVADSTLLNFESNNQHTITVRGTDASGVNITQEFIIRVTNVNEAPIFTSTPANTNISAGSTFTYNITTTDPDALDTRSITATSLPSWLTLTNGSNGTATLTGTPNDSHNGLFNIALTATDAGGLKTTQNIIIGSQITLAEQTNFVPQRSFPLVVPAYPSILSFKIDPTFDLNDLKSINDAFEVALVDKDGNSIVHTIAKGRDAFFNLTEGEGAATGAGASYNATTRTVSLNLMGVKPGEAQLIFRLVNNDSDTTTNVKITDFALTAAPTGTTAPTQSTFAPEIRPGATPNFNLLTDVSNSLVPEYGRTSYNADTKLLYADISIRNTGTYSVDTPLLVAVKNINDPRIVLRNPDGFTPSGMPYFDFSSLVADGKLNRGGETLERALVFYNPNNIQFIPDLVVLAQLNKKPVIDSKPVVEVIAGQQYRYDVNATDPNSDTLTYKLLVAPTGMTIDDKTGLITWNTTTSNRGNQSIVVEVSDSRGGVETQRYNLSVIDAPPNRPPVFTTTPKVDAVINAEYKYDADATDPDGDNLTYNLALAPEGMTVNPTTGEITWMPGTTKVLGNTVIERIASSSERDTFTFGGVRGDRIYFDSLIGSSSQKFELFTPSGNKLIDNNTNYQGAVILTETGNYSLVVSGTTGEYGFSLIDFNAAPVANFEQNITGVLTPGSEDDAYRFNGNAGQRLYLETLSSNRNLDWVIYDANNQVIASTPTGNTWGDMEVELPASGQYVLVLRGKGNYNDNISYSFRIIRHDTNSTQLTLGTNSTPNTVSGSILKKGEQDVYTFTSARGTKLYLDTISANAGIHATLISPSGDRLKYFNNYRLDGSDSSLFTLEEDGAYSLVIDGDGATTGAYSFNLLNATVANSINLDTDVTNRLDPGKETHLYRLSTTVANQRLYLDSLLGSPNASWTLYGPSNQIIRAGTLNTDLEATLPTINTYTLAIQSNSDSPIDYQFRVVSHNPLSTPLSFGSTVSSEIAKKREQDIYTFSASADTRLFLDALQESPNINARLISPSGFEVFNTRIASDATRHPVILLENGSYQLIVDGTGELTGSYSFRLHNLSTATTLTTSSVTTGTLNPGSSTNVFRFTGNAGNRLYLDSQTASPNATWLLYGPGNQLIDSKPLGNDFEVVLPGSGTYYLMLRGDGTTTPIDYRIQVVPTTSPATALTLGSLVSSGISQLGEQDVYTFNATTVGQRLYFDSRIGNNSFTARLVSPSGVSVWNGNTTTDSAPIVLLETGEHRLIIDGLGDTTGTYSFLLTNLAGATSLPLSTTINISLSASETRLYSLNGTTGQRLRFDSLMAAQNANWVLYAPDGSVVNEAVLSNDFEALLPTNGSYILALRSTSTSTGASASFRVDSISSPTGTNSGFGTIRSGTITTGQINNTFTARAGTIVYFDSQILSNGVTASLLDPSSNQVFSINAAVDSNLIQLQQSGTYTIRLEGNGEYRYNAIDLNATTDLTLNTSIDIPLNPREARTYKFNGTVGQQIFYDALNNNNPNATVRLFTPGGKQILLTQAQLDSELITLSESGTYFLIVSSNSATNTSVNFRLLDSSAIGAASLGLDTNVFNSFSNGGLETDLYRFNGTAGQSLYFDSIAGATPNTWTLYSPGGQQLESKDLDKDFEIVLPSTGQYLLANIGKGGSVANYQFQVVAPVQTTTSISLGSTISGSISKAGEQDTYTFSGSAGQRLFFDGISDGASTSVRLISPSGIEIFNLRSSENQELFTLAEAGTYRIVVDAPGTTTGNYSFRLLNAAASTLTLGSTYPVTVAANQTQLYTFSGTANQYLYFENNFTGTQSTWTLYGPGNQIVTSNNSGADRELALTASGNYVLALNGPISGQTNYQFRVIAPVSSTSSITSLSSGVGGSITQFGEQDTYTFTGSVGQRLILDNFTGTNSIGYQIISPSGAVIYNRLSTAQQLEPFTLNEAGTYRVVIDGDGRSTGSYSFRLLDLASSTNLTLNTNISGVLSQASQAQLYRFTGTKGQNLYFDLFGEWNTNNGTGWALYGPGNQLVASNFNRQSGSSDLEVKLPSDGTYTLMIDGRTNVTTAESFQFRVTTPQALTLGSTVPGSINAVGKQDIYTFDGTAGTRLFFDGLIGSSNITAKLFNPSGFEVVTWSTNTDSNQVLSLLETGAYRLVINGNNNATGNYSFRLVDLETVSTLAFNTPVTGRLDPGAEVDFYQFYAPVGQKFNFDLTATQWTNANWVLYGPSGAAIATPSSTTPDFEITPEKAGTYVLAVRGSSSTLTDYNFRAIRSFVGGSTSAPGTSNSFVLIPGLGEIDSNLDELGTHRVLLDVLDGRGGKASQSFKIRVRPEAGNNSPVIISNPTTIAYTSSNYIYDVEALDSDKDSLTYALFNAPQGMTINANTGIISWDTPVVGQRDVTVRVQDTRGGVDTQTFNLNVSDGIAPGQITGKVYVGNGLPVAETVYFQNFESDTSQLTEWSNVNRNTTPTGRKFLGQYGGPSDGTVNQGTSLTLNNLATHDTVTVSFDLYIIASWDGFGYGGYQPDLWKLSVDGNPTPILYTAFGNYWNQVYPNQIKPGEEPIIGDIKTGASEVDTLGYNPDAVYKLSYTFAHSDSLLKLNFSGEGTTSFGDSESWGIDNVKVTVGRNAKPLAGTIVYADQNGNQKRDAGELFTRTDNQGNYSLSVAPGNYTIAQETKQGWTQTLPTGNIYSVTVSSNQTAKDIDFANIIGLAENVAPDFLSAPPTSAMVGRKFVYESFATDLNSDSLTYDLVVKPDGMVVDSATGTVVWKPTLNQVGEHDVILRVKDPNGGVDLQSFKLTVSPLNNTPVFTSGFVSLNRGYVGQTYRYQFTAIDADGDSISYSLAPNSNGASIDPNTGLFSWTPQEGNLGNNTFNITISDGRGGVNTLPFGINILPAIATPANSSPTITSQPRSNVALGQTFLYAVTAFDPDNDLLTYALDSAPTGMTIDTKGVISWTPGANQLGATPVTVRVSDGRGGVTPQTFNINVQSVTVRTNSAPSITSAPNTVTNIEREYQYNLTGADPDKDLLLWSLDKAPLGMVIDVTTGALRWKPTANQIGEHTVAVRLTDALGQYVGQEFILNVTYVNTAPQIVSTPITRAAQNQRYTYTVIATDPENDALTYSIDSTSRNKGITIDRNGVIQWTPTATQVGSHNIEVTVSDTQGGTASQTYAITVGTVATNNAPSITSTPVFVTGIGSTTTYRYQVVATDPDAGDTLTYQLLSGPAGMTISSTTGLLTWTNPTAGTHQIVVGAVDRAGLGAAQRFTLTARANSNPVISSKAPDKAIPGTAYIYDVKATDPNGDALTYSLDSTSLGKGMTIDANGRLRWAPTTAHAIPSPHAVLITVSDGNGGSATETINLSVARDTEAPKVRLIALSNTARLGEDITFQARATDNVKVASLKLTVDGTPVILDANGIATVKATRSGTIRATATATDTSNNTSTPVIFDVTVIDPNDIKAPTVNLDLSAIGDGFLSAPTDIRGTISDDTGIKFYRLIATPVDGGESKTMFEVDMSGQNVKNIDRVLGKFDPSLLQNDSYTLRLEVEDIGGNISYSEGTVSVAGDLKLGNFRLSFTDLTVPVTGIPITLTRTYDTLTSNTSDDFGYGWRMEFRDTDLRTSVGKPSEEQQMLERQKPFLDGTKVYITLPGGKREAFTFRPKMVERLEGQSLGVFAKYFYRPEFVADFGGTSTLTVESNFIRKDNNSGEFYGYQGNPYNPADSLFGGKYTLTTKEGVKYEIDALTGDLLTVIDTNGNKLTYTDGAITSSTGQKITFERDGLGRITTVKDPEGTLIKYDYDTNGDLVAVTDREKNVTRMEYINDNKRKHYLNKIIDPLGRTGLKNEYDEVTGRLKEIIDVNGKKVEMTYDTNASKQTVKDARGYSTTYVYDSRGNILTEIDALAGVITRTYDDDNNVTSETDADGVTTNYTYDNKRNLLTIEDENGNITRMTYDKNGRATTIVSPTGLSTSAKYDGNGNLIESVDTDGLKTIYKYNDKGQLRFMTAPDGQVTEYDYDRFGNPNVMVDSRGNKVKADYDFNGRIQEATTTFTINGTSYTQLMEYDYDSNGRTIASRTSQGNSQSMTYDTLGRVTTMTDAFGNVTSYRYDLQISSQQSNTLTIPGSVVTRIDEITMPDATPNNSNDNPKVIKKYDQNNNLIAEISPTGLETRYIYDELGRLVETIIPDTTPNNWDDNPRVKTGYSVGGRVKFQTDIFGNKEEYDYNNLGQLVLYRDVLKNQTTYTYNKGGQIETITDPRTRKTQYVYDEKARFKEAIFFDSSRYKLTYDTLGRVQTEINELNQTTTYEYDAFSQVKAVINALNERTEFEYDHRQNLIRVTDANQNTTRNKYDEYGRKVETTFHNGDKISLLYDKFSRVTSVTDENLNTTKYSYNNLSQLTQIEQPKQLVDGQLLDVITKYRYDNLNLLREIEDANNNVTKYEYDNFYRPTATILPMGQRNQTVYNKFGQVVSTKDFNGATINYNYDTIGRLDRKTFTDSRIPTVSYTYDSVTSQMKTVTDGRGVTKYDYDTRDRLKTITMPDQKTVSYGYDLLNNITSLTTQAGTTTYGYDKLNRLDTVFDGNRLLADYDYDKVGNLIQTKLANSSTESRQYDTRNRLTQVTTKNVTGTIFSDFKYTLDAVGNRKKVEEFNGRVVDYTYDSLYRLNEEKITDATAGNRTIGYTYDLAGNRLSKTDTLEGLTRYTYDANNRLKDLTQGSKVTNFTYDNNGSLRRRSDGAQTVTYDWINDGENRLIGVNSGTSQTQHIYDAFGSRVASINNGVRTNYLSAPIWNLPEVLMEYDANGQITADYTNGIGLVRARRGGREGFYHTDGLGSTRVITDAVGLITDRYTYDAFGVLLNQNGTFGNSFQFAGEQRDGTTGLDYLRARYYDPSLGRFISKDAYAGTITDPYSQHDYQYAHANPVRYTDPTGYFTLGDVSAAFTMIGIMASMGGVGAGVGYIAGAAATGASGEEILGMFGEWGTGFASGVSGGFLTDVYEATTGKKIEPKHAMLYNAGNVTGIGVAFLIGMRAPTWAMTKIGPLKWVAAVETGLDVYGAAKATYNLYQSYQDNGKFEREDAWNLLAYVPFAGALFGVKKFFAANKAKNAPKGINNIVREAEETFTHIKGKCFVAGTEILTTEGIKNIEDIKVGDWVIADDPTTPGEIEARQVTDTFVRQTDALVDLYIDGEVVSTTGEHPFWTPDKGWVEAKDLEVGSLLQTEDGRIIDVDRVERREGQFEVYNFSVEGFHTYFVSELGILVHNADYSDTVRIGRWMSPEEFTKMQRTGVVQESYTGTTYVAVPADPEAFMSQAKPGAFYVEFDVPASAIRQTKEGWAGIKGPNSLDGRLAAKKGLPMPEMPAATNITHRATKLP
ncbi:MAG: putative Ig domain-containing protein [Calothrix sp. C42_A2020_038]|nr:putative Ig domain-containing protein [Calothrix sp. C42_A2020_038]